VEERGIDAQIVGKSLMEEVQVACIFCGIASLNPLSIFRKEPEGTGTVPRTLLRIISEAYWTCQLERSAESQAASQCVKRKAIILYLTDLSYQICMKRSELMVSL
jgi:hypothetical protein